jgi:hypothetical protein
VFLLSFWVAWFIVIVMSGETKAGVRPEDRLLRMRQMFSAEGGILEEDYRYFTRQGEPTPLSKEIRKSVERRGRRALKRS